MPDSPATSGLAVPPEAHAQAELLRRYEEARPHFESQTQAYKDFCDVIVSSIKVPFYIEARTKSSDSFKRKAAEPEHGYVDPIAEMNDISGLRITVASLSDAELVWQLLMDELEVDEARSSDKGSEFEPNQFGYRSRHLISRVDANRRSMREWQAYDGWVEIQIRTACQHAWAQVDRLVRYKTTADLPVEVKRRLFALAAVLEVCDSEIESVLAAWQDTISSASDAIREEPNASLTEELLVAYIQTSSDVAALSERVTNMGVRLRGFGHLRRDIAILSHAGISSIADLETLVTGSMSWAPEFFEAFLNELKLAGLSIGILERNALCTLLVIASQAERLSGTVLRDRFNYGLAWAALAVAPQVSES